MLDLKFSIESILQYIKAYRFNNLYFLTFLLIIFIVLTLLVDLVQKFIIEDLIIGNHNFVPLLNKEWLIFLSGCVIAILLSNWIGGAISLLKKKISNPRENYDITFGEDTLSRFNSEWLTQGNVFVSNKGLFVTDTHSGILLNATKFKSWWNFTATIEVDFNTYKANDTKSDDGEKSWNTIKHEFRKILGIIIRAQSLDDYYMTGTPYNRQ